MSATVILCVISTLSFCVCVQTLGRLVFTRQVHVGFLGAGGFSIRARRLARTYLIFSFTILTAASLWGAVVNFIELFK